MLATCMLASYLMALCAGFQHGMDFPAAFLSRKSPSEPGSGRTASGWALICLHAYLQEAPLHFKFFCIPAAVSDTEYVCIKVDGCRHCKRVPLNAPIIQHQ